MSSLTRIGLLLSAITILGCNREMLGPCYNASDFRRQAEKATGNEKAVLEGKALAADRECQQRSKEIQDAQRRDLEQRRR